jgi:hypothetical protein
VRREKFSFPEAFPSWPIPRTLGTFSNGKYYKKIGITGIGSQFFASQEKHSHRQAFLSGRKPKKALQKDDV